MNTKQCWHVPEAKRRPGWISVFLISTLCLDTLACRNSSNNPQATGDAAVTASSETKETASSSLPNVAVPDDDNNRPKTVEEVVRQVENGVVLFKTFNSQGKPLGSGTGFALDSSGRIATNFHIFRYAHSATVEFHDKSTARVDGLVAWDVQSDLAIAQLESATHPLTALRLSESTDRPNGMSVIAIGHPQGLKFTTTTGILSAAHQTSELPNPIRQAMRSPDTNIWLQTTAVIDGGSSGGPLLDGTGSVIGINTMTNRRFSFSVDVRHLRQLQEDVSDQLMMLKQLTGPDEKLQVLVSTFRQKYAWHQRQPTGEHPLIDFCKRAYELAESFPIAPASYLSLQNICAMTAMPGAPRACDTVLGKSVKKILSDYPDHPQIPHLLWSMKSSELSNAERLFREFMANGNSDQVQGTAAYCLATFLMNRPDTAGRSEAKQIFSEIPKHYPGVVYLCSDPRHPTHDLATESTEMLYRLEHLSTGSSVMEIIGEDIDGESLTLSEYRGKVVVLDFWAAWCPPCINMLPHERKLVARLKGQSFALVGVFCDDPNSLRKLKDSQDVNWRNFVVDPRGPTVKAWRTDAFPTLYILDREGVIRFQHRGALTAEELNKQVDLVMAEYVELDE